MSPSTPAYQPAIDKITALNTRNGKVDVRGLEAYAHRLATRAEAAGWRGEEHEADHLRTLAYVHRAAAVQARASRRRARWWARKTP